MSTITIAILIFVVTLILYGVNKFSMGTVGMITMAALLVTGCLAPKDALGYFANKNVILMLSMFVVSAGLSRTTFLDAFQLILLLFCIQIYLQYLLINIQKKLQQLYVAI